MPVELDPFQLIQRVNFPPGVITAENVGTAGTGSRSNFFIVKCSGGTEFLSGLWYSFAGTNDGDTLLANLTDCDQSAFTIVGRTSGARQYIGNLECGVADCNGGQSGYFPLESFWSFCSFEWLDFVTPGYADFNFRVYSQTPWPFASSERIDIEFGAPPKVAITSITQITATVIQVTAPGHGLLEKAKVVIAGTPSYDGTYNVHTVAADTVRINRLYVGDESGGTITAQYT